MSKSKETAPGEAPAKKKGGLMKILIFVVILLVVTGGAVGGTVYAFQTGLIGGGGAHKAEVEQENRPRLVPKSEEKRASLGGEGDSHGGGSGAGHTSGPIGSGGDKFASTYYSMDKEFTSNLRDSVHYIQVGLAVSTPYDDRVLENLKTHEIAVRSAILMALGDATEDLVFTNEGKRKLQIHLTHAINDVLKQKEGFGGISNVYFTNFVVQ